MTRYSVKRLDLAALIVFLVITNGVFAADKTTYGIDQDSGLIMAPGWEVVKGNCTACHSAKFITWQRGDRETWKAMIRWMQKTQGLWQFPPYMETTILDYLAANYPPGKPSRRANLSPSLMPQ